MTDTKNLGIVSDNECDVDEVVFNLNTEIELLQSQTDKLDYLVAASSGLLCGLMDIFWVKEFDLSAAKEISSEKVNEFVRKTAGLLGCNKDDMKSCVKFLENKFPIPSDGNTPDFGGGLQHHLRDFAHHPTVVGLAFSLLTQFTENSYGTDVNGNFIIVPVTEKSKFFIGSNVYEKVFNGSVIWFFHLVSDMAGSSGTAGNSGGTGIPGPLLSLAKEMSVLPIFKGIKVKDGSLSQFLSKLFNGTLFAQRDSDNEIIKSTVIKLDLRAEIGIAAEIEKQVIPVIANECIVRIFYFIRRLFIQIKEKDIRRISDLSQIDVKEILPNNNPTLTRMVTLSTAVFTSVDLTGAVATRKCLSVNYPNIGRFVIAMGQETINFLKVRELRKIKAMYEKIKSSAFTEKDNRIYRRIAGAMDIDGFGLTVEQTEILYNIEMLKVMNDISCSDKVKAFSTEKKEEWLNEWKNCMKESFAGFIGIDDAVLHWHSPETIIAMIRENEPEKPWLRLVLLESMLFTPYYPLSVEKKGNGKTVPSTKYAIVEKLYSKTDGDGFLDDFLKEFIQPGYVKRLRKSYNSAVMNLNETLKTALKVVSVSAGITVLTIFTAGTFAPSIAVLLVGSNFAGLSGAALTSACLAYMGGGAIAAGGLGMAGGTAAIVGGGALLGTVGGATVGGAVGALGICGKEETIKESAKLIVSVKEIFLNDEHDVMYSNDVCEQLTNRIKEIESGLSDCKLKADIADRQEKKKIEEQIKNTEKSVEILRMTRQELTKFQSSFEDGLSVGQS